MNARLRASVAVLLMVAASLAAEFMRPTQLLKDPNLDLNTLIPAKFGDWVIDPTIIPIKPTPDVQANLDTIYDQIVARTYVNSKGERMMLSIAYGGSQSDDLKAHRQEVCYASQGFKITELLHDSVAFGDSAIPITRMVAVLGSRSEPVTYWFTIGDRVVLSRFERLIVQLKYGLSGEIPDGMLVRVSNISTDARGAYSAHVNFVHELIASMRKEDVPRLLGAIGS